MSFPVEPARWAGVLLVFAYLGVLIFAGHGVVPLGVILASVFLPELARSNPLFYVEMVGAVLALLGVGVPSLSRWVGARLWASTIAVALLAPPWLKCVTGSDWTAATVASSLPFVAFAAWFLWPSYRGFVRRREV